MKNRYRNPFLKLAMTPAAKTCPLAPTTCNFRVRLRTNGDHQDSLIEEVCSLVFTIESSRVIVTSATTFSLTMSLLDDIISCQNSVLQSDHTSYARTPALFRMV